jgi:hypothetical protein
MVFIGIFMSNGFPNHRTSPSTSVSTPTPHKHTSRRHCIDYLGGFLLLAAMTMHITGFEEVASLHPWKLRTVLIPLVLSVPLWFAILRYQSPTAATRARIPLALLQKSRRHDLRSLIAIIFFLPLRLLRHENLNEATLV